MFFLIVAADDEKKKHVPTHAFNHYTGVVCLLVPCKFTLVCYRFYFYCVGFSLGFYFSHVNCISFGKICKLKSTMYWRRYYCYFVLDLVLRTEHLILSNSSLTFWPLFGGCWEGPPPPLDPWSTADPADEISVFSPVSHPSCFCFFFFSSLVTKIKRIESMTE